MGFLKYTIFITFVIFCGAVPPAAAVLTTFEFSGQATLSDPYGLLGEPYGPTQFFSGSLAVDWEPSLYGYGEYYDVDYLEMNFDGFSIRAELGRIEGEPYFDYYTAVSFNSSPPLPEAGGDWGWGEVWIDFSVSPDAFLGITSCDFWFFYVFDYPDNSREFDFVGTIDSMRLAGSDSVAVPESNVAVLFCVGLVGACFFMRRQVAGRS